MFNLDAQVRAQNLVRVCLCTQNSQLQPRQQHCHWRCGLMEVFLAKGCYKRRLGPNKLIRLEISYLLIYIIHVCALWTPDFNSQALAGDLSIIESVLWWICRFCEKGSAAFHSTIRMIRDLIIGSFAFRNRERLLKSAGNDSPLHG